MYDRNEEKNKKMNGKEERKTMKGKTNSGK
jgi:hypothetical protein